MDEEGRIKRRFPVAGSYSTDLTIRSDDVAKDAAPGAEEISEAVERAVYELFAARGVALETVSVNARTARTDR